jgi:molybdenum cofactor cytidylyltransferase
MIDTDSSGIEIVLLAAGGSSRLGHPKQLVRYRGQTLLRWSARQALDTGAPVHVVLGASEDELREEIKSLPVDIVVNPDWRLGISGSIKLGCQRLAGKASGVLIMLCDQPLVTTAHLEDLIKSLGHDGRFVVASEYSGILGVPAVFGQDYFDELMNLEGDEGARVLIIRNPEDVVRVKFADASLDIDSEADVETLVLSSVSAGRRLQR